VSRYATLFQALKARGEAAFIPFVNLGDPEPESSYLILKALVDAGADALELGMPFSDPIADGPTIQRSGVRALEAGFKMATGWSLIARIRAYSPTLPIGLLVYSNLVVQPGIEAFYRQAAGSGVDSVVVGDIPVKEIDPFRSACMAAGIEAVLLAPPNASEATLRDIARLGSGYTYVVSRSGVTGADQDLQSANQQRIGALKALGAPPCVVGFGISQPAQAHQAIQWGAEGVISGSAVVDIINKNFQHPEEMLSKLKDFVRLMKSATLSR
jgi:tryptophan synthase alpha chain